MHSQLALTEHASLNLAPLILLDPVLFLVLVALTEACHNKADHIRVGVPICNVNQGLTNHRKENRSENLVSDPGRLRAAPLRVRREGDHAGVHGRELHPRHTAVTRGVVSSSVEIRVCPLQTCSFHSCYTLVDAWYPSPT